MKTFLKYESRIQEIIVGLLLFIIILLIAVDKDIIFTLLLIDFFLIAIFQYSINLIKFFQKLYPKTIYRKMYVAISTYCVLIFLGIFYFKQFNSGFSEPFFGLAIWSLVILPPILIIQSLLISYSDKNLNNEKYNI